MNGFWKVANNLFDGCSHMFALIKSNLFLIHNLQRNMYYLKGLNKLTFKISLFLVILIEII